MVFKKLSVKQIINEWQTLKQWKVENEVAFHFVFILSIPYYLKWCCLFKIPSKIILDIAKKMKIRCHEIGNLRG